MKNPKILPFGSWFKVYESAGRSFNKSQMILESKLQKGIQAIYESSIPGIDAIAEFQNKVVGKMDGVTNSCFGEMDAVWKKALTTGRGPFSAGGTYATNVKGNVREAHNAAKESLAGLLEKDDDYSSTDDKNVRWILGKMTGKSRILPYNNARKNKVYLTGANELDSSFENLMKGGKANIYDMLATLNSKNLRMWAEEIRQCSIGNLETVSDGSTEPGQVDWKNAEDTSKYGWEINQSYNIISKIDTAIGVAEYDHDTNDPSFASGFKPGLIINKEKGTVRVSVPFYTVDDKTIVPQGGLTISGNEWLSSVVVVKEEQAEEIEQPLGDVKELFVVGKTNFVSTAAQETMKKKIQKVLDTFESVVSIRVKGGASKEGTLELNKTLVDGRSTVVANLIKSTWKNIPTEAIQGEYDKIQTEGEIDPNMRTVYLYIKGTKMVNKEKVLNATNLANTEFKADLINIKETIVTCTFSNESDSWQEYTGKVAKKSANKDEDWNSLGVGDQVRLEVTGKDGNPIKIKRKITKVEGEGNDKVVYYNTPSGTEKSATRDQFVSLTVPKQQIKNVKRSLGIGSKSDL